MPLYVQWGSTLLESLENFKEQINDKIPPRPPPTSLSPQHLSLLPSHPSHSLPRSRDNELRISGGGALAAESSLVILRCRMAEDNETKPR